MPEQPKPTQITSQPITDKQKKVYHTPLLTEHGDVRELTQSTVNVGADGDPGTYNGSQ